MYPFTRFCYEACADLFHPAYAYPGYRPHVHEVPNGDGQADLQKKYLHIAPKYNPPPPQERIFGHAFAAACIVAEALDLPPELRPSVNACALRVLDYPPGAGSEIHTDMDFFTLNLWRSEPVSGMAVREVAGYQMHLGELAEIFGYGKAEPHSVPALPRTQQSLVFFALPDPHVILPTFNGVSHTVGSWLSERYNRSRVYK